MAHEDYFRIRGEIIDNIFATDMTMHGPNLNHLKEKIDSGKLFPAGDDKGMCLKNVIHAADIGNPSRHQEVAVEWSLRIM